MQTSPSPRLPLVIEALNRRDRRKMAALIAEELREGPPSGEQWAAVATAANQIGEIDLGLDATRRYALTEPRSLDRALTYCNTLAARGRVEACRRELEQLSAADQQNPAVLYLRRSIAMRMGEFGQAEELARRAIALAPNGGQYWQALTTLHTFKRGDADLARMEALAPEMRRAPPDSQAAFFYALGKARHDCGDYDNAFAAYSEGAAQMRTPFDWHGYEHFVRAIMSDFSAENLARLTPSRCDSDRAIFVMGLPRSGTTLVEQILASHSEVADGEEVNLLHTAFMPAGDFRLSGALAYEQRGVGGADPWGEIARDYLAMLDQRFGPRSARGGRIVDKTLNHSLFMGLILHALPKAKVIWLRRNPEDTAISCFRSYFGTTPLPWSLSLADIGRHFRLEDALYQHWLRVFPERILTVPYEQLVADSKPWITKILTHLGLGIEPAPFEPHKHKRVVQTVSVMQVREPISASSVGGAEKYRAHMQPFREAYSGA